MKLIVGLGNPGKKYSKTRHNLGFVVLDNVVEKLDLEFKTSKFDGKYIKTTIENEEVIFLKPQSYINFSGEVIRKFIDYFNIKTENILIVHDDLDLTLGTYKLKQNGSSAGHNGLNNIEENLKTKNYKRLKIGISKINNIEKKDYVLGKFSEEEEKILFDVIKESSEIVINFINMDFLELMNKFNGR